MPMYEGIRFLPCADLVLENHGGLLAVTSRQGTAVVLARLSDLMPMSGGLGLLGRRRCRTR